MWSLRRTKENAREILMDDWKIYTSGKWMDPYNAEGYLPLTFETRKEAEWSMQLHQKEEPEWNYEVNEYLN